MKAVTIWLQTAKEWDYMKAVAMRLQTIKA